MFRNVIIVSICIFLFEFELHSIKNLLRPRAGRSQACATLPSYSNDIIISSTNAWKFKDIRIGRTVRVEAWVCRAGPRREWGGHPRTVAFASCIITVRFDDFGWLHHWLNERFTRRGLGYLTRSLYPSTKYILDQPRTGGCSHGRQY